MGLVSFIAPALIGTVNKNVSDTHKRFWVSFAFCFAIGALVDVIQHDINYVGFSRPEIVYSICDTTIYIIGLVKLSYEAVWNNPVIGNRLPDNETPLKALGLKPDYQNKQ